jgi:hypothetical protein
MDFIIIHVVFGNFLLTICLFVVCKNYLDIVHLILDVISLLHIAFHLHDYIMYFSNTLHLFLYFSFNCL